MRILAKCPKCFRQYDATEQKTGDHFHCHCGSLVTVPSVNDRFEAQVVRCMNCGASRAEQSQSCRFCQASFTLLEQDLLTVCPSCFTRISQSAHFCHRCGNIVDPQEKVGQISAKNCPACTKKEILIVRTMHDEGVTFLECPACSGMWLGSQTFLQLQKVHSQMQIESIEVTKKVALNQLQSENQQTFYRRCPECSEIMNRKNFGRVSGIIIDICSKHGLWFDSDELAQILKFIRGGGLTRAAKIEEERALQAAKDSQMRVLSQSKSAFHDDHEMRIDLSSLLEFFTKY